MAAYIDLRYYRYFYQFRYKLKPDVVCDFQAVILVGTVRIVAVSVVTVFMGTSLVTWQTEPVLAAVKTGLVATPVIYTWVSHVRSDATYTTVTCHAAILCHCIFPDSC